MTFAVKGGNVLRYILFLRGVNVWGKKKSQKFGAVWYDFFNYFLLQGTKKAKYSLMKANHSSW